MGFSVLLAGFDPYFTAEVKEAVTLCGADSVWDAQDAAQAHRLLERLPDVLITELILMHGDGICLLERCPDSTAAVAASTITDPFFYDQAARAGALECIARPVSALTLAGRSVRAMRTKRQPKQKNRVYTSCGMGYDGFCIDLRVQKLLLCLSLPVTLDGFAYLRFCILACIREPALLGRLTKCLYPMAAEEFHVSPASVERSMRYAVEHIFDCARIDMLDRCFGASADPAKGKLSVGAFLAQMVQLAACDI